MGTTLNSESKVWRINCVQDHQKIRATIVEKKSVTAKLQRDFIFSDISSDNGIFLYEINKIMLRLSSGAIHPAWEQLTKAIAGKGQ